MPQQQRSASVPAAARPYGLPHDAMRRIIKEAYVTPRAASFPG
jgi:hypothetical protein